MRYKILAVAFAAALPTLALAGDKAAPAKVAPEKAQASTKPAGCGLELWGMKCRMPSGWSPFAAGPNSLLLHKGEGKEGAGITIVVMAEEDLDRAMKNVLAPFSNSLEKKGTGAALPLNGKKARAETYEGTTKEGKIRLRIFAVTNPKMGTTATVYGFAPEASFEEIQKAVDEVGKSISLGDIVLNVGAMAGLVGEWKKTAGEGETDQISFANDGSYQREGKGKIHKGRFAIVGSILILRDASGETLHIPLGAKSETELLLGQMTFQRQGAPPKAAKKPAGDNKAPAVTPKPEAPKN
jgi:hypothetical protein